MANFRIVESIQLFQRFEKNCLCNNFAFVCTGNGCKSSWIFGVTSSEVIPKWHFCQTCRHAVEDINKSSHHADYGGWLHLEELTFLPDMHIQCRTKKNLHAMWAGTVCFISNSCSGMKFLQGSVCSDGEATNLHAMWPVGRSFCRCMAGCKRATGEWFCYAVNFMQKLIQTRMDITGLARRVLNVQVPIAASSKQHWHHLEKMVFVRARVKQLLPLYMYIYTVWGVRGVSLCVQMFTRIED